MANTGLGYTSEQYMGALQKLLPQGPAWELEGNEFLYKVLELASLEFARIDNDILMLIREASPETCSVTFDDWCHQWGIPDKCLLDVNADLDLYRTLLCLKIYSQGYSFVECINMICNALGFETVSLYTNTLHTVSSPMNTGLYDSQWGLQIIIHTEDETSITYFRTTSSAQRRLAEWGIEVFECIVKSFAPCWAKVVFSYGNVVESEIATTNNED
jgi:uncharacterized protein YmfQ (DUF2313 family)